MDDYTPLYNLKAVCKETGLSPATLRAWERRYGLIVPKRSPGGHRLYTRHDVELLKWLLERQKEGLSISRAVELWKSSNQFEQTLPTYPSHLPFSANESMVDELREGWIAACMSFDDKTANQILQQAFAIAPPEMISVEVIEKGLMQIGERWYQGTATVQQEHFASAMAIRRLNTLIASCATPTRVGSILVACPPGEEHDFILLLITYLLRRNGWDVIYLGANVPISDLDTTIRTTKPVMILSAAQTLVSAASLREMSEYLVQQDAAIAYGGRIFQVSPDAIKSISGYYLGDNIVDVPHIVEDLILHSPKMPQAIPVSEEYHQTLAGFMSHEADIKAFISSSIPVSKIQPVFLEIALTHFSKLIASSLSLGDIHLIQNSITWLDGLLNNYDISPSRARLFYNVYLEAVDQFLGDSGRIIHNWLSTVVT